MKNYTVEDLLKNDVALKQNYDSALENAGKRRGSNAFDAVKTIALLEILEQLRYFKKLSELVYPKEYLKLYAKDIDEKIGKKYADAVVAEDATLEDLGGDLQKIRKYIDMKGYEIEKFEVKPANFLVKSILKIEEDLEALKVKEDKDKE